MTLHNAQLTWRWSSPWLIIRSRCQWRGVCCHPRSKRTRKVQVKSSGCRHTTKLGLWCLRKIRRLSCIEILRLSSRRTSKSSWHMMRWTSFRFWRRKSLLRILCCMCSTLQIKSCSQYGSTIYLRSQASLGKHPSKFKAIKLWCPA